MGKKYRQLTEAEIATLEANGCECPDWKQVEVAAEGFDVWRIRRVIFAGNVRIGSNGIPSARIYDATIIGCSIGDNAFISHIGEIIGNYDIGDNVQILNTGAVVCDGTGNFGNGVEAKTINEAGGREVVLFNGLSAQFAYIAAMYRENEELTEKLRKIALAECAKTDKSRGKINNGACVCGCGKLLNVNVGEAAVIEGAGFLKNGTVNSSAASPARIGLGVKAYDFVISEGAKIDNGALLERCFVGENCRIDQYFSATDCLFFANSDMANGEACSVFAGPFTVSHHRSSLLIAGYFSFFNAGSGSNQSNHLFKTGAVHQGIHERGCKFGSNAYVMLPAREGAFSVVMGRHTSHHDTTDLPYSYLVEEAGKTYVIPGANLRSCGSARDFAKWPARDRRIIRRDRIHYAEYNPYTGEKLLAGIEICERLLAKEGTDVHTLNRIRIKTPLLKRGLWLYRLALKATLGEILSWDAIPADGDYGHWADMAGMFAPAYETDKFIVNIVNGAIGSLDGIEKEFDRIGSGFKSYAKAWAIEALSKELGCKADAHDIETAINEGAQAADTIAEMRRDDCENDNDKIMITGYGIDSPGTSVAEEDFLNVRKAQQKK